MNVDRYRLTSWLALGALIVLAFSVSAPSIESTAAQEAEVAGKGGGVTKIVFIHHSVGGNWLAHDYGGLVSELNRRGFYVNDITYRWSPPEVQSSMLARAESRLRDLFGMSPVGADRIGSRTDIGQLYDWFSGPDAETVMAAVYRENSETDDYGDHANATSDRPLANPGATIENEVVMIKPCYPNSLYRGEGSDPATPGSDPPRNFAAISEEHTVANCKRSYNDILNYFASRPDKFFVIVTAPPRSELPQDGRVAREFSTWLARDWLRENRYSGNNVMVFDLYNVLTSRGSGENDIGAETGNHHRLKGEEIQHLVGDANNLLVYARKAGDNHPSKAGLRKATAEFVDLFVYMYRNWKG